MLGKKMTTWRVELDEGGQFIRVPKGQEGNFRVQCDDIVQLYSYSSSLSPMVESLYIEDPIDNIITVKGSLDAYQNWEGCWQPSEPGPYRLQIIYKTSVISATPLQRRSSSMVSRQGSFGGSVTNSLNIPLNSFGEDEKHYSKRSYSSFKRENHLGSGIFSHQGVDREAERRSLSPNRTRTIRRGAINVVIVEAKLMINKTIKLPIEAICMQTVMSVCLGDFSQWKTNLELVNYTNYNVLHFTPLQTAGESGSCYSLANQNEISSYFTGNPTQPTLSKPTSADLLSQENFEHPKLIELLDWLESEFHILSTTDIVLNHTASNSPWLSLYPNSGYTLENSPHLLGALELDLQLQSFSMNLIDGKYGKKYHISATITTEDDLSRESNIYCQCSTMEACDILKAEAMKYVGIQRGASIILPSSLTLSVCENENQLIKCLQLVQQELIDGCKNIEASISAAFIGHIRWERIICQKGPIGRKPWERLIPPYFTAIVDSMGIKRYLANNGYGSCKEEAPFLWEWMEKYCQKTAKLFHGIRLDNCHSTPIHVAK
ncbi:hypothetical protein IE077_003874, partial [Cardiosporidium cionae]